MRWNIDSFYGYEKSSLKLFSSHIKHINQSLLFILIKNAFFNSTKRKWCWGIKWQRIKKSRLSIKRAYGVTLNTWNVFRNFKRTGAHFKIIDKMWIYVITQLSGFCFGCVYSMKRFFWNCINGSRESHWGKC